MSEASVRERMSRPVETAKQSGIHLLLLAVTAVTTTWAGAAHRGINPLADPGGWIAGLPYAAALLGILGIHEMGHYLLARRRGVAVTLPYFIPAPFYLGTFGAFIQMRGVVRDRATCFDIAVAGPLAGLAAALIALAIGLPDGRVAAHGGMTPATSALFAGIDTLVVGGPLDQPVALGALAFAGWIGLVVTALNLIPATVEVLIPDFKGSERALRIVMEARPDILNHNLETAERLCRLARPGGRYDRALEPLARARGMAPDGLTKSGIILGMGEEWDELLVCMRDLRRSDVNILTLGQYLRPSDGHLPVARYYTPDEFAELREIGQAMGSPTCNRARSPARAITPEIRREPPARPRPTPRRPVPELAPPDAPHPPVRGKGGRGLQPGGRSGAAPGPATRPVSPGPWGSSAEPAGSISPLAPTSTRAGSATTTGGRITDRRRPGMRSGR